MSASTLPIPGFAKPVAKVSFFAKRGATKTLLGGSIVGLIILFVVLSPWIAPYDPIKQALSERLRPPMFFGGDLRHLFGTDELGRDLLSRVMSGGRVSLTIAALAVVGSTSLGTFLGLISAYYGGKLDSVLTMLAEIQLSLPSILIIIVFLVVFGPSIVTLGLILALSDWVSYSRTMRGRGLVESARDYIVAARAIGVKDWHIILRHLWPNVLPTLLVLATLSIGSVILTESSLSYLGLGIQRPFPSWGRMVSDGQAYITNAWWISTIPALVIGLMVFGLNLLGDGLRQLWKME
ncbi:putative D,D-dipeptide transport system permease protein DdpC [Anaerolineae bacterium]|nr:putative D,D-dipeptide transport system permease protein DdpC [Anaerolineae bacterium]